MNRWERWCTEERFVELSTDAVLRRHPQGVWLTEKGRTRPIPLSDRALMTACEGLESWLSEHGD